MLRFLTAGESHGKAEIAILEGMPAGLLLDESDIDSELRKRRSGAGRGERGLIEKDEAKILSGVRMGKTIGSPIAILVENQDFPNWRDKIGKALTNPRPGHADLAGAQKYGFDDIRNVIERASARETIMRVAVGAICKKLLAEFGMEIASHTVQIGTIRLIRAERNFQAISNVDKTNSDIRCIDPKLSKQMRNAILDATRNKNTLGGTIEVIAHNVLAGLGSHVHWDRKLDGEIAQMLMSTPSVKAVEIGEGINSASMFGSDFHDEIFWQNRTFKRKTNRAGGIEGGISNGEDIICRVYHKPISTLPKPLTSVDMKTKKKTLAAIERSDICIIPRAGVISEAAVAFVLAKAILEKFGGDSMLEMKRNCQNYIKYK